MFEKNRPVKILVVDDDSQLRLMIRHVLQRSGYDVDEAGNGHEAMQILRAGGVYAAVIVDMVMPEKEGTETILDIRRYNPAQKIIAMSGGGRMQHGDPLKRAQDCGAHYIIAKPFTPDDMRHVVWSCCR